MHIDATDGAGEALPTGMFKREGRYVSRRVVPKELRGHFGRTQLTRALGTNNLSEAKSRHHRQAVAWDEEFKAARSALRVTATTELQEPAPESATVITIAEAGKLRERAEEARKSGTYANFIKTAQQALIDAEAMILGRIPPDRPIAFLEGSRAALRGFLHGSPSFSVSSLQATLPTKKHSVGHGGGLRLSAVVSKWAIEGTQQPRTVRRVENIVSRFTAATGKEALSEITRKDVLRFKDSLLEEGQSAANVNVMIPMLGTIFRYAMNNDLTSSNPATGIRVADNRKSKERRRSFSLEELSSIFSGPVYILGDRPAAGAGEAAYWLPLIGLFTGARLTEIGQLYTDDLYKAPYFDSQDVQKEAWIFRFGENSERGQRLKNDASDRIVPVHRALIDLGLLFYVDSLRSSKATRVFPEMRPNSSGELTANWSKWFGRHRRKMGIKGKDTPFHSFRHTFKDQARAAGIHAAVHNAITGHETGDVADSYGGLAYPLKPLVEAMNSFRVPGLTLPAPWKPKD